MNSDFKKSNILSGRKLLTLIGWLLKELLITHDQKSAMKESLQKIGEHLGVDRVYLFSTVRIKDELIASKRYEYIDFNSCMEDCCNLFDEMALRSSGFERWADFFEAGLIIDGYVEDFPESEKYTLMEQGVVSILCIPLFIDENLWGFFGIDSFQKNQLWKDKDKEILEIFANTLAGAVYTYEQENKLFDEQKRFTQFYDLVDSSQTEIHIFNKETFYFSYMNKSALKNLGYHEEEYKYLSPIDIVDDMDIEKLSKILLPLIVGDENYLYAEAYQHRKNGSFYPVEVRISKMIYDKKEHFVIMANDITKRNKDDQIISNQQTQLKSANETLNKRYEQELRLRQELEFYKTKLEDKVEAEVQKNREKDRLLHNQSKSVQTGEMLSMIAHQWRQPLNAISASAIGVSMKHELNELTDDEITNHTSFVQKHTQLMSKTITDFMDFFKPENEKQQFNLVDIMNDILSLMGTQLDSRGIKVQYDKKSPVIINGYRKELSHVLINFITNSRDAYEKMNSIEKTIDINFYEEADIWSIVIQDYAGGIQIEIIDKIFNPYFTTKEQGKGTGIGLYMSKRIIEEVFNGRIEVKNINSGANFAIIIPKS